MTAPTAIAQGVDCTVYFTASLGDQKKQLGDITLYRRGPELVFVPELESLPGTGLLSRWNDTDYWLSFPTLDLPPGRYRITAWSERAQPSTTEITVTSGPLSAPELTLDESKFVEVPHKNKLGQDYPKSNYDPTKKP